jgi:tRNA A58 N-methylase Trm61
MVVADVGAGTGLFTRKFAAEVSEKGRVFAVEVAPAFLRHIEKTCEATGKGEKGSPQGGSRIRATPGPGLTRAAGAAT